MIPFELAGGSVIGRDHRVVPRNNQDAYWIESRGNITVAVVCDGCGSSPHSEVGAQIGAPLIASALLDHAIRGTWSFDFVLADVLAQLRVLALQMDRLNFSWVVYNYLLFSTIGVVLSGAHARFFSLGDGVIVVNGEETQIGPFPDNEPPYLGYGLLASEVGFEVPLTIPLSNLDHFLIGCDGAGRPGLLQLCDENRLVPGTSSARVGPVRQFWEDDRYFTNPVAISRRLKVVARDWPPRDPEHGLLADDTTIIVGRRIDE